MISKLAGAGPAILLLNGISMPGNASERALAIPRLGDTVPISVPIIGVDGSSSPAPFGIVILEGRVVMLVEGATRRIVEITSDDPKHGANERKH